MSKVQKSASLSPLSKCNPSKLLPLTQVSYLPSKQLLRSCRIHLPNNSPRKADMHKYLKHKKRFAKKYKLQFHHLKDSKNVHRCGFCSKVFTRKRFFISHLLEHNEEKLEALNSCEKQANNLGQVGQKQECLNYYQNQNSSDGQNSLKLNACRKQKLESTENCKETLNKTLNQNGKQKQKVFKYCLRQKKTDVAHCKIQVQSALEHLSERNHENSILDSCKKQGQLDVGRCKENQNTLGHCPKQDFEQDNTVKVKNEDSAYGQDRNLEEYVPLKDEAVSSVLCSSDHEDDCLTNGHLESPNIPLINGTESNGCVFPIDEGSRSSRTLYSDKEESAAHTAAAAAARSHRYFCMVCGKGYLQKGSLTNHEASHTGKAAHQCNICSDVFHKKLLLRQHLQKHHLENPPICEICGKTFRSDSHLKTHLSVHRDFTCDICGNKFTKSHHLKFHQFTHSPERPLKCKTCGKGFKTIYSLRTHQLCHTEKRRHICELCGKGFKISSHLYRHLQGHTERRNFTCVRCGKSFKQKCHLKVHMYTHTGERRFRCGTCGKGFTQNSYLEKHKCCMEETQENLSSKNEMVKIFNIRTTTSI